MFRKQLCSAIFLAICSSLVSLAYADAVWIDVRSTLEYKFDNIEGDIRISHGDIVQEVSGLYPDKSKEIRLYCRSGGRAEKALASLKAAGYRNVVNVGSISSARKARGISE